MAQQEDGWPLGLQPLNARVGLVRNHDRNGSISFSTLLTASSSTQSSSDLDTESTGSFFRDKSITLGTLMGVSSILELSRRSMRLRPPETLREKKSCKLKPWLFSFCSKLSTDAVSMSNTPSLGHFLEAERRATSIFRQNTAPSAPSGPGPGSMFVGERSNREMFEQGSGYGAPLLLSCLCRQLIE